MTRQISLIQTQANIEQNNIELPDTDLESEILHKKLAFVNYLNKNYPEFAIDKHNRGVLDFLFRYFFGYPLPEACEANPHIKSKKVSHKKWILIIGTTGTGKTMMLKIFSKLFKFPSISCDNIRLEYEKEGSKILEKYSKYSFKANYNSINYYPDTTQPIHWLMDDLGAEKEAMYFGKREEVMRSVITHGYDLWVDYGLKRYITSNRTLEEIEGRYKDRVASRIYECCNVLRLLGPDRRKQNNQML